MDVQILLFLLLLPSFLLLILSFIQLDARPLRLLLNYGSETGFVMNIVFRMAVDLGDTLGELAFRPHSCSEHGIVLILQLAYLLVSLLRY